MKIDNKNFYSVCRICLTEKHNMNSIFEAYIPKMLMSCADIQIVEDDKLPKLICIQCLQQVNRSYMFKQLCEKSDRFLREFLKKVAENEEQIDAGSEASDNKCYWEENETGKSSLEYVLKTEQLKLEISEHLKIGAKKQETVNVEKTKDGENSSEIYQCDKCGQQFKGNL